MATYRRNRLVTINDALMKAEHKISNYEKSLISTTKRIDKLKVKKEGLAKLLDKFPQAKYSNGNLYLEGVGENWDKVAGMSIERTYGTNYRSTNLVVKFSLNKKYSEGVKVFMIPQNDIIAKIVSEGYGKSAKGTIEILDYKNIIPESCRRRKSFTRRIKFNILDKIKNGNLTILDSSVDKDDFIKLMLLK